MSHFNYFADCNHYKTEWENLVAFIQDNNQWEPFRNHILPKSRQLHHIEAKALAIFSIAWRLIDSANSLAERKDGWDKVFIETATILFPMIELIGSARLGDRQITPRNDGPLSGELLGAGIDWLRDSSVPPTGNSGRETGNNTDRLNNFTEFMDIHNTGPTIQDLFFIRHYFIHGIKSHDNSTINMPDTMNYEIPQAIVGQATRGLRKYWRQLILPDSDNHQWIERLAEARIHPFKIQGSLFEKGLLDPHIVSWLEE